MTVPLYDLVESESYIPEKAFTGIGIGPDGVPIDLLRVHLLGHALDDFSLLVADEFSSQRIAGDSGLGDLDLIHALNKYNETLSLFKTIWPNSTQQIFASDLMDDERYTTVLSEVENSIRGTPLEEEVYRVQTEWGIEREDRWRFAVNELAVIEFLRRFYGIGVKIGPHSEGKYDSVMGKISPDLKFVYMRASHSLSGTSDEPSPYAVDNINAVSNRRILVTDEMDTVEEKLRMATPKAKKYFALLGSLAGRALGHSCFNMDELECKSPEDIEYLAQIYVLDNIIAPLRRARGVSVYGKTPMRRIYDQTLDSARIVLKERVPNLGEIVRPELNSINSQLLFLLSERAGFAFNPEIYNEHFPHLSDVGVLREVPSTLYAPVLDSLGINGETKDLPVGLDLEIMSLLQRRLFMGYHVAVAKLRMGKSVYDGKREKEVIEKMVESGRKYENLNPDDLKMAVETIMDTSKGLQDLVISRFDIDFKGR